MVAMSNSILSCLFVTFALLLIAARSSVTASDITLCSGPDERYRSTLYQVDVEDAGPAFVYYSKNGWGKVPDEKGGNWEYQEAMSADNHWVAMSTSGRVNLTIRTIGITANKVELLPERPGNTIAIAPDGAVQVKISPANKQADYYFVRINGDHGNRHPLFVFVDPPETDIPQAGPGVHFFGPGVHDIGTGFRVKKGETVYIAAGALVRGTIRSRGSGITVRGRGILSGELMQEEWIRHKRGFIKKPKDAIGKENAYSLPMISVRGNLFDGVTMVEGITIIDAPSYNLHLLDRKSKVKNVKLLSWNYSTDGVGVAGGGLVENCFFKVQDDVFTMYSSDLTFRNMVIWKQHNAAVFQLGYGYSKMVKDCLVEHVDIIRDETKMQSAAYGIISLTASKGCSFKNMRFQDIKVYGNTLNLLAIDNLDQDTLWAAKVKNVELRNVELDLNRVTITGTERGDWWLPVDRRGKPMRSRLRTSDSGGIRVKFENVSINGKKLLSPKDFPNGLETAGDVRLIFQ
jgi:hypothetical protein